MNQNPNKISTSGRKKARSLAVQAIYQWQFTCDSANKIIAHFLAEINEKKTDVDYFADLVNGVLTNVSSIDAEFTQFLDRDFSELDQIELAILRIAVYEFLYRLDVPYKVIINEALELTKTYGSIEGFKYVNGILDKAAKKLRATEQRKV